MLTTMYRPTTTGTAASTPHEPADLQERTDPLGGPGIALSQVGYHADPGGFVRALDQRPGFDGGATSRTDITAAASQWRNRNVGEAVLASGHGASMADEGELFLLVRRTNHADVDPLGDGRRVELTVYRDCEPGVADQRQPRPSVPASAAAVISLPLQAPLIEARDIDASAGPDRSREINQLRAGVTGAAELAHRLADAERHARVREYRDTAVEQLAHAHRVANEAEHRLAGLERRLRQAANTVVGVRHDYEQAQSALEALRVAEDAQRSRQAWLDAHPDVVGHVSNMSDLARRQHRAPTTLLYRLPGRLHIPPSPTPNTARPNVLAGPETAGEEFGL